MKRIEPSKENLIALEACILNNKTLKAAFIEFAQNDYTFEQVRGFYYKYKESLLDLESYFSKCECGKTYQMHNIFKVNKYLHKGVRRVIDAIITFGLSERVIYSTSICPFCGKENIMTSKINW